MAVSYRHNKRAGNFGDVHKHVALLSALSVTTGAADATSNRKVLYIETHAASGSYESTSSKAEDTGVGRVLAADEWQTIMSQDIQAYADTIKRYRSEGAKPKHGYPGSPLLALSCLRTGIDEAIYAEYQQDVANELSHTLSTNQEENDISISTSVEVGDGYAVMRKKLASLSSYDENVKSTVPFILIDPPFTDLQSELDDIPLAIRDCLDSSSKCIIMVWYPIKKGCDDTLLSWKEDLAAAILGKSHRLAFSEIWTSSRTSHSIGNKDNALVGSGIALIHRHDDMTVKLMSLTKELHDILASCTGTNSGSWSVLEC